MFRRAVILTHTDTIMIMIMDTAMAMAIRNKLCRHRLKITTTVMIKTMPTTHTHIVIAILTRTRTRILTSLPPIRLSNTLIRTLTRIRIVLLNPIPHTLPTEGIHMVVNPGFTSPARARAVHQLGAAAWPFEPPFLGLGGLVASRESPVASRRSPVASRESLAPDP